MTDVRFDTEEEDLKGVGFVIKPLEPPKGFYRFFIKLGVAKNNHEAGRIMAGIAILAVIIGIMYPIIFGV
jgi:hypothetical protein